MSKQKCIISKKRSNFFIVSNEVAQVLNYDLAALGLYVYLFSLPNDWEFHKSHLRKVCNIGVNKLNNLLRILAQHKLVKVAQIRKKNGQFSHFDIHVDDGSSFIINTLDEIAQRECQNSRPVENGVTVNSIYKEDINKDEIIKEKDKNICATESVAQSRFDEFWSVYPLKKDKKRADTIWKKEKLDNKAEIIIKDVKNRILNDQNWNSGYTPHPSTYLKFERWTDEVTLKTIKTSNKFNPAQHTLDQLKKKGLF